MAWERALTRLKTLTVAQQKGGVGKTCTIVHLAFAALERGKRCAVIDLDSQGNAADALQAYQLPTFTTSRLFGALDGLNAEAQLPAHGAALRVFPPGDDLVGLDRAPLLAAVAALRSAIAVLADLGYDTVLIDTPPNLSQAQAVALYVADFVLSPVGMERWSIKGFDALITTIQNVREQNGALEFLGMLPSMVNYSSARHKGHLTELRAAYADLVLPCAIGLRGSIADACATGVPVWQIRKTAARKAKQEMRAMTDYVLETISPDPKRSLESAA
jgi:chromosome partitioning protein